MAKQQVGGNGATMSVPTADRARNTLQNVEDLYNLELVTRVFADGSIPDSKLESGGGGGAFAYVAGTYGLYGTQNTATAYTNSIQIGAVAEAEGDETIAIGSGSYAGGLNTIVMGNSAYSFGSDYGIAIGGNTYTAEKGAIAIGETAHIRGINSVGIGYGVYIGNVDRSVAIGDGANITNGADVIAILGDAKAGATESITIGSGAYSNSERSVTIGHGAIGGTASGYGGTAIGANAFSVSGGTSLGRASYTVGYSVAVGNSTDASANLSTAIGANASVSATGVESTTIGANTRNTIANSVMLGTSQTEHINFDTWSVSVEASAASTHSLPIKIGGTTYRVLLTNA